MFLKTSSSVLHKCLFEHTQSFLCQLKMIVTKQKSSRSPILAIRANMHLRDQVLFIMYLSHGNDEYTGLNAYQQKKSIDALHTYVCIIRYTYIILTLMLVKRFFNGVLYNYNCVLLNIQTNKKQLF